MFKRDFFAAYRKSFFGLTWLFLTPAVGIISWVFLQKTGILNPGEMDVPYPVYVLLGTTLFGLFMSVYTASANTLEAGKELALQIKYPHEALLFKQVAEQLANFTISFAMILLVLVCFRVAPSWKILLLPLAVTPLTLLAMSLGLVASMINVVATDLGRMLQIGLGLTVWVTPVIYSNQIESPFIQTLIRWNPLTYQICSCRDLVLNGSLYAGPGYWITSAASVILFLISWRLFYVSEDRIIERLV